ncbi:phosphatase PAP2 family protein [Mesorhizobium sp. VK23B]|uniref:Phosphatase PAP2 family protein n=1 Tax=Mesorhizobium dulcispinae TaxID=3072316 RepID=A0ABU4XAW2_9HYPH|nr:MULTISPECIES: phosphatase PAP2 family protein [unclassified Mesorhizobium]MDX8464772.1 phosphatase PAP2 family protein [Mesorhizobium sp. VK23B]MDX8471158.1 phosphatase PAP2 family protein [Mesorhizobium sp. VK23A]
MSTLECPYKLNMSAVALYRRSLGNFLDTIAIVRRRFAMRPARYPEIPWFVGVFAWLLLAVAVGLSLDSTAGRMRGEWTPGFVHFADFFTDFGLGGWYLIPAALCLVAANLTDWRRLPRETRLLVYNWTCFAFLVLCAVGLSGLAVNLLKYGIGRARPLYFNDLGVLSLHPFAMDARFAGFPSGHATTMGAVFGILLLLFPKRWHIALAVMACTASTRVFVGAHYPSDTVAGFGLGLASAIVSGLVFARLGFIFRRPSSTRPVPKRTFRLLPSSRSKDTASQARRRREQLSADRP